MRACRTNSSFAPDGTVRCVAHAAGMLAGVVSTGVVAGGGAAGAGSAVVPAGARRRGVRRLLHGRLVVEAGHLQVQRPGTDVDERRRRGGQLADQRRQRRGVTAVVVDADAHERRAGEPCGRLRLARRQHCDRIRGRRQRDERHAVSRETARDRTGETELQRSNEVRVQRLALDRLRRGLRRLRAREMPSLQREHGVRSGRGARLVHRERHEAERKRDHCKPARDHDPAQVRRKDVHEVAIGARSGRA